MTISFVFVIVLLLLAFSVLLSGCSQKSDTLSQPSSNLEQETSTSESKPKDVVESFMLSTLGSLANAEIDYDKARTMMTSEYAAEFTSPMFIPQAYGMQDGPDRVGFENQDIMSDKAEVVMMGYWGEDLQMRWKFELVKEEGEWKIDLVNPGQ